MMPGFLKLCVSGIQCTAISNQSIFYIYGSHDSSSVWILCHLIQIGLIHLPAEELTGSPSTPFIETYRKLMYFRLLSCQTPPHKRWLKLMGWKVVKCKWADVYTCPEDIYFFLMKKDKWTSQYIWKIRNLNFCRLIISPVRSFTSCVLPCPRSDVHYEEQRWWDDSHWLGNLRAGGSVQERRNYLWRGEQITRGRTNS